MPYASAISIIGTVFFLGGFGALNFGLLKSTSVTYQMANFLGAVCFTYTAIKPVNYGLFITEFLWACFGIYGLYKIFTSKDKKAAIVS